MARPSLIDYLLAGLSGYGQYTLARKGQKLEEKRILTEQERIGQTGEIARGELKLKEQQISVDKQRVMVEGLTGMINALATMDAPQYNLAAAKVAAAGDVDVAVVDASAKVFAEKLGAELYREVESGRIKSYEDMTRFILGTQAKWVPWYAAALSGGKMPSGIPGMYEPPWVKSEDPRAQRIKSFFSDASVPEERKQAVATAISPWSGESGSLSSGEGAWEAYHAARKIAPEHFPDLLGQGEVPTGTDLPMKTGQMGAATPGGWQSPVNVPNWENMNVISSLPPEMRELLRANILKLAGQFMESYEPGAPPLARKIPSAYLPGTAANRWLQNPGWYGNP